MDTETIIIKDTQTLQSEMQTLVYENYNKFITATETIRKMKTDFLLMENEMKKLQENMIDITESSHQITSVLHETRTNLTNLTEKSNLLKKLSAISSLPAKLTLLVEEKNYTQAVQEYNKSQWIFQLYGSQTSFRGIQEDCKKLMNDLRVQLKEDFERVDNKTIQLTQIGLLLQLGENPTNLSNEILQLTSQRLHDELINLQDQTERDMMEFVDLGIENFLNDLIALSSVYYEMFIAKHFENELDTFQEIAREKLNEFVTSNITLYLNLVHERVDHETESGDCQILLRALDRLNRRLCAMKNVIHGVKISTAMDLIIYSIQQFSRKQYRQLKDSFNEKLSSLRLTLVTTVKNNGESATNLNQLIDALYENTIEKVKHVLQELAIFLNPEWSFNIKTDRKGMLLFEAIRDQVLIKFLRYASSTMTSFSSINSSSPCNLVLVLMKMCLKMEKSGVRTLLMFFDELYEVDSDSSSALSYETEISSEVYDAAKILLDTYVRVQGMTISQMFRKSVETRDWVNCLEPRAVRAVMKRVVDDLTAIEITLEQLLDSELQPGTSKSCSDSSKKNPQSFVPKQPFRSSLYAASQQDSSANLMYRLFSERVEIFNDLLDFSKVSVLSNIIKKSLKTLLECIRLRSFSKFGLQQVQVDTHYLQLNLWRFVADEK